MNTAPHESQGRSNLQAIRAALLDFGRKMDPRMLFPVLEPAAADLIFSDPFAFALATCLDRGTKAEIVWTIPYYIRRDLGHLDPYRISRMSIDQLADLFHRLPKRPRYTNDAPITTKHLAEVVVHRFGGDASNMWREKTAAQARDTFRSIHGVGPGISNMAVLLLERGFGLRFPDRKGMDIKCDVHTTRILYRLGVAEDSTESAALHAARLLNPAYPGEIDGPLWIIGRQWCHASYPTCSPCPLNRVCQKQGV